MTAVLGLDLSLTATGWARLGGAGTKPDVGTITTKPAAAMEVRLAIIAAKVVALPVANLIVIEDFVTGSPAASKLGMVHGAVRVAIHQALGSSVLLVPPATLKVYGTGKGNATKADMRMALYQRTGLDLADDNQVDAVWLAHLGHHALGQPLLDLPKTHTRALDKLDLSRVHEVMV